MPLPLGSPSATTKHVLKRMAVPDKRGVHEVGKEVDVMVSLTSTLFDVFLNLFRSGTRTGVY